MSPAQAPEPPFCSGVSVTGGALGCHAVNLLRRLASQAAASRSRSPADPSTPAGSPAARPKCCLARRSLTTREIADRLYISAKTDISAKTADHHIQHVYSKIGASTRAAAALWATQHALAD